MAQPITRRDVILTGASLLTDSEGENPEYDRAIVELVSDLVGFSTDDRDSTLAFLRAIS